MKIEWSPVLHRTSKGKQYIRDSTVQEFLEETVLDPSVAGKRQRIDLASVAYPSSVSPKNLARYLGGGSQRRARAAPCSSLSSTSISPAASARPAAP